MNRSTLLALSLLAVAAQALAAQAPYPETPVKPVRDRYHGVTVTDPYRWMENMAAPEFQAWLKAQSEFAAAGLKTLPGRQAHTLGDT